MMKPFFLSAAAALALLPLSGCQTGHITPSPEVRLPATSTVVTRGVVLGPAGQTVRHLERAEAQRLVQLLASGRPMRNINAEYFRFQPLSYSVGFARGSSTKWSAQFYGKAKRVVLPNGATLTYTKAQRREILQLVDPEKRWRY